MAESRQKIPVQHSPSPPRLRSKVTPSPPSIKAKMASTSVSASAPKEVKKRQVVKIRVGDHPELEFDGTEVSSFIKRYEMAGDIEGASGYDLVIQILTFVQGKALRREVEEMEEFEVRNWEMLKEQMLAGWEEEAPTLKYTIKDLQVLVEDWERAGGLTTRDSYGRFNVNFIQIVEYLVRYKHLKEEDNATEFFFRALGPQVQETTKRKLIDGGKMMETLDGTLLLPSLEEVRKEVEGEMSYRKVMAFEEQASLVFKESNKVMKKMGEVARPAPRPQPVVKEKELEKKVDEITKMLQAFMHKKEDVKDPPPHQVGYQPRYGRNQDSAPPRVHEPAGNAGTALKKDMEL